jgi:hypothetical protein
MQAQGHNLAGYRQYYATGVLYRLPVIIDIGFNV